MSLEPKRIILSCPDEAQHAKELSDLYGIFKITLNVDLTEPDIRSYYFNPVPPFRMDITFLMHNSKIAGFYSVSFYEHKVGKKTYIIARVAIGIMEEFRGGNVPAMKLYRSILGWKILHPFKKVIGVFFLESPLMYAFLCRRAKVYPQKNVTETADIRQIRQSILKLYNQKEVLNEYVIKVFFSVLLRYKDLQRVYESKDENLRFFLNINPQFYAGNSLLTIFPVSWMNIISCCNYMAAKMIRMKLNKIGN